MLNTNAFCGKPDNRLVFIPFRYLVILLAVGGLFCGGLFWASPTMAQVEKTGSPGVVIAAKSWDVTAIINGRIGSLNFTEGQLVIKGDLLVELDDSLRVYEVELAASVVRRAEIILSQRQDDLDRQKKLKDREVASVAAYKDAEFAVELAEVGLATARLQLKVVRAALAAHKLHAPETGLISAPRLRIGSNFDVSDSGAIATIVQLDPINTRVMISLEKALTRLQAGTFTTESVRDLAFTLELSNGTKYPLPGRIVSVGFDLNPETGMGSILVEFPNPDGVLRPGLPVVVRLGPN